MEREEIASDAALAATAIAAQLRLSGLAEKLTAAQAKAKTGATTP